MCSRDAVVLDSASQGCNAISPWPAQYECMTTISATRAWGLRGMEIGASRPHLNDTGCPLEDEALQRRRNRGITATQCE